MKKDRNCGTPMYQGYANAYPVMGMPNPMMPPVGVAYGPNQMPYNQTYTQSYNNNFEKELSNMQQQINSLENRVAKLESKSTTTYNNKYSDSNYYML